MKTTPLDTCSHLALWPGLYVAGSAWYTAQLVGADAHSMVIVLVFAFLVGVGTYLLDRAKLRDAWLDPADAAAHPSRFAFVRSHAPAIRLGALGLLGLAVLVALTEIGQSEWWSTIPVVSYVASVSYAAVPRGDLPRPKDLFIVKNAYVAAGIALFSCAAVIGVAGGGLGPALSDIGIWSFAGGTLAVRVFIDAALCDLDDRSADRRHRTVTFPVIHGRRAVLNGATLAQLGLAGVIAASPVGSALFRWTWAGVSVVSALALRIASPRLARDVVDARLLVEAAAVAAAVWLMQSI